MSTFIKHIPCENCGSKDNAGLYSDGHTHCFGCGHRTYPNVSHKLRDTTVQPTIKGVLPLPYDATVRLDNKAYEWLLKTLTTQEIQQHRLLWSNSQQLLIFPFFEDGELIGWQARNFSGKGPKYYLHGVKSKFSKVYGKGESLVFTEDLLSAIVVSRSTASRPLFGTSLPQAYLQRNSRMYLWLDYDKRIEALRQCNYYRQYGYAIAPIFSEKDPKSYSKDEVDRYIYLSTYQFLEESLEAI